MLTDEVKAALEGATLGPWKWQEHTQDGIVGVLEPYMCQGEGFIETSDANARLIALSPDMARALIAAEEMADATEVVCDQVYNRVGGVSLQAVAALRAALTAYRKAGETHAD